MGKGRSRHLAISIGAKSPMRVSNLPWSGYAHWPEVSSLAKCHLSEIATIRQSDSAIMHRWVDRTLLSPGAICLQRACIHRNTPT